MGEVLDIRLLHVPESFLSLALEEEAAQHQIYVFLMQLFIF